MKLPGKERILIQSKPNGCGTEFLPAHKVSATRLTR
jgi:hypothetical protein